MNVNKSLGILNAATMATTYLEKPVGMGQLQKIDLLKTLQKLTK